MAGTGNTVCRGADQFLVLVGLISCAVSSSTSINPFADARMLLSKSAGDDIEELALFEVHVAQFIELRHFHVLNWRS